MSEQKKVYLNTKGEEYEPMIPGTKCPVSVGVLEQWYWGESMTFKLISTRLRSLFFVSYDISSLRMLFNREGREQNRGINSA